MSNLSIPQQKVIKAMRRGSYLRRASHILVCTLTKGKDFKNVQYSTVNKLLRLKLLTFKRVTENVIEYFLTDLGNEVKLK